MDNRGNFVTDGRKKAGITPSKRKHRTQLEVK